ncbi:hypothetical protein L218DRAFT_557203 [Marasmius fiardii PR-910]|nr:hypothetical protein L218DRAFT_557203 [Marasmius fiardii PR-910]
MPVSTSSRNFFIKGLDFLFIITFSLSVVLSAKARIHHECPPGYETIERPPGPGNSFCRRIHLGSTERCPFGDWELVELSPGSEIYYCRPRTTICSFGWKIAEVPLGSGNLMCVPVAVGLSTGLGIHQLGDW